MVLHRMSHQMVSQQMCPQMLLQLICPQMALQPIRSQIVLHPTLWSRRGRGKHLFWAQAMDWRGVRSDAECFNRLLNSNVYFGLHYAMSYFVHKPWWVFFYHLHTNVAAQLGHDVAEVFVVRSSWCTLWTIPTHAEEGLGVQVSFAVRTLSLLSLLGHNVQLPIFGQEWYRTRAAHTFYNNASSENSTSVKICPSYVAILSVLDSSLLKGVFRSVLVPSLGPL